MKKILSIIFILVAFTSCSNDNDDNRNSVMGNWKLVKAVTSGFHTADNPTGESITDYSDKNIIYSFDTNSNLTISIDGKKELHKYEYKVDYLSGAPSPAEKKGAIVIIDGGSKMTFEISDKGEMILGLSYVDGSNLYFVRQ